MKFSPDSPGVRPARRRGGEWQLYDITFGAKGFRGVVGRLKRVPPYGIEVFCFFFSKKKALACGGAARKAPDCASLHPGYGFLDVVAKKGLGAGVEDGVGVEAVFGVEFRDVAGLAEVVGAEGDDALAADGAEPGVAGGVAVEDGDEGGIAGQGGDRKSVV